MDTVGTTGDLWRDVSAPVIDWLLTAFMLSRQPDAMRQARLRVRKGALKFESIPPGNTLFVGGPAQALVQALELTRSEWTLIESIHEAPPVGYVLGSLSEHDREMALLTLSRALRAGLFEFEESLEGQA